jgi:hypothetical protein
MRQTDWIAVSAVDRCGNASPPVLMNISAEQSSL